MCSRCISRLRSLRRELEQIPVEPWEEVQNWVAKATPIFISDWPESAAEFRKVTLPPSWKRGLSPVGIRLNCSAQSRADRRAACRQEANKILAENKKQEILSFLDGLLAVSSYEEDDESQLLMGTKVGILPLGDTPLETSEKKVGIREREQMGTIPWVIVNGTLRDVWACLKRQQQRWEDQRAPVMMAGPLSEAGDVNCLVKPVKDVAQRLPDELHFGKLKAIELSGEQHTRVTVFFEQHHFPEPVLFWQAASELIEAMRRAGLELEMPASGQPSGLDDERSNGKQPYSIATIRKLLLAAFTPEDLRRFCLDRPTFDPIVDTFGPGHGLDDMVDRVIDYCRTRGLWEQLLAEVKGERAKVYARFAADFHLTTGAESENWEWRRILLRNRKQYFVHEGRRHHLDPGAGQVCDAYIVVNEKLDEDEEARFLRTVPEGDEYNETIMRALLRRIYPERADDADKVLAAMGVNEARMHPEDTSNGTEAPRIGIVTALETEFAAMEALLENTCELNIEGRGAGRRYLLGETPTTSGNKHSVVLALAGVGNNSAANRATRLLEHFPKVDSIIMVGIAGGVPHPGKLDEHVRLGDIVVSNEGGVIQYDFVKEERERIIPRHLPRPPSPTLLEGVRLLEAGRLAGRKPWLAFIDEALCRLNWTRPPAESDVLADSRHPEQIIDHPDDPERVKGQPRILRGPIASANDLLKNPIKRDELRDSSHVKAVEMEGSGIADATWAFEVGYLVVRGICDYCDSNKGDLWQKYAAVAAAAYARALLESIPPRQSMKMLGDHSPSWSFSNETASPTALSCMRRVVRATKETIETDPGSRGGLRCKYRNYLGVVIDRLDRSFGKAGEFKEHEWPPLVHHTEKEDPQLADRDSNPDPGADRRDFFELHIKPVIEQIKPLVGNHPQEPSMDKEMDQLRALRVLCTRLENVVDELDAAFQDGNVTLDRVKDLDSYLFVVRPLDSAMATTDDLRSSYAGLHVAWHEWLRVADVT